MPRRLARRLRHLPVVLLVAVACVQVALSQTAGLTAWVGGGFGMFSTTDGWGRRHIHAWAVRPGLRRELPVGPELGRDLVRALALPDERGLRALAERLAALPSPDQGPLEAIELHVYGVRFDRETLAPAGVLLRSHTVRFDGR
jgi:hypothetical protein